MDNAQGQTVYALSSFGWGLPGAAAHLATAHKAMRGLRYWYSAAEAAAEHWPLDFKARLSYPVGDRYSSGEWATEDVAVASLLATKVPSLGCHRLVHPEARCDDGLMRLSYVPADKIRSRSDLYSLGYAVAHGAALADVGGGPPPLAVPSFTLQLLESDGSHFAVDGEPLEASSVRVTVLPRQLRVCQLEPPPEDHVSRADAISRLWPFDRIAAWAAARLSAA